MKKLAFTAQAFSLLAMLPMVLLLEMNHVSASPTGKIKDTVENESTSLTLSFLFCCTQEYLTTDKDHAEEIIGFYWSPKKDAKIEVYEKGKQFFGKFVWLAQSRKDHKNPATSLQSREVLGLEFLTNFTFEDGTYSGGELYDPETGKTYNCKMSLEGQQLKVRGFFGISLLGRTEYFERIKK